MIKSKKTIYIALLILISILCISFISSDLSKKQSTASVASSQLSYHKGWSIEKSGIDSELDIYYEMISDTQTKFCVNINDKEKYLADLAKDSKSISEIPIQKISNNGSFDISVSKLDLSAVSKTQDSCFFIDYPKFREDLSFKIGWNTVLIISTNEAVPIAFAPERSICRDINGVLQIAFEGSDSDLWYGNSTDNGATWSTKEILASTITEPGILCYPNGTLTIYYNYGNDALAYTSGDNGVTWSASAIIIEDDAGSYLIDTCAVDGNNVFHCLLLEQTNDIVHYTNSTFLDQVVVVNGNTADDTDYCDIAIAENNCVYAFCAGTDQDDIDVWSPCTKGWGDTNRTEIYNGGSMTAVSSGDGISAVIVGDNAYVAFTNSPTVKDIYLCNSTLSSNFSSSTCQVVVDKNPQNVYHPSLAVSQNPLFIDIFYTNSTTSTGVNFLANSTDGGITWSNYNALTEKNTGYPEVACSTFPTSNRVDSILYYLYSNSTGSLLFDSITRSGVYILSTDTTVLNTLNYNLRATTMGSYNNTMWYTWNGGIKNYTICSNYEYTCNTSITFPRQGYYDLIVYANKSDNTIASATLSDIFVGNLTKEYLNESGNSDAYINTATSAGNYYDYSTCTTLVDNGVSSHIIIYLNHSDFSDKNVINATFNIYSVSGGSSGSPFAVNLRRLNTGYIIGSRCTVAGYTPNWKSNTPTSDWTSLGGDINSTIWSTVSKTSYGTVWVNFDITNLFKNFTTNALPNFGVIIQNTFTTWNLDSSEFATDALRPYMNVTYYSQNTGPTITNTINDSLIVYTTAVNFTYNISDDNDYLTNISLYLDGVINQTVNNQLINVSRANPLSFNVTGISSGLHSWFIRAFDSDGVIGNSSNFTFTITSSDTTYPIVNITYPLNITYSINVSNLNYTIIETNKDSNQIINASSNATVIPPVISPVGGGGSSFIPINATEEILVLTEQRVCNIKSMNNFQDCIILLVESSYRYWMIFLMLCCSMLIFLESSKMSVTGWVYGERNEEEKSKITKKRRVLLCLLLGLLTIVLFITVKILSGMNYVNTAIIFGFIFAIILIIKFINRNRVILKKRRE